MLRGLMMDRPLLVSGVIDYAADVFPDVEMISPTEAWSAWPALHERPAGAPTAAVSGSRPGAPGRSSC